MTEDRKSFWLWIVAVAASVLWALFLMFSLTIMFSWRPYHGRILGFVRDWFRL
jgi:hypothetical protein